MPQNERQIKSQMKVGAGLALVGVACPFFWISLSDHGPGFETWVYGIHSWAFIVIGIAFLGKGWYDLKRFRSMPNMNNSGPWI